jgi:hypothetical protein
LASKRSLAAQKGWATRRARAAHQAAVAAQWRAAASGWKRGLLKQAEPTPEAYDPDDYDDEDNELAELWGVTPGDVEDLREVVDFGQWSDPTSASWDHGRLADYIDDLADAMGVDEDEIWDIWWQGVYGGKEV